METPTNGAENIESTIEAFMKKINLAFEKSGDIRISFLREAYTILDNGINLKLISNQDLELIIQELAEIEIAEKMSPDELRFFNRIKLHATTAYGRPKEEVWYSAETGEAVSFGKALQACARERAVKHIRDTLIGSDPKTPTQ
jgi:hypothetical protein